MKIVKSAEAEWMHSVDRGKFGGRRKALGGERIGCGLWELPAGKTSWPFHRHLGTEEAMFVISGRARVRTSDGDHALGPGDFVSFPASDVAHQLINESAEPFVYVAVSHSLGVDVVEYPDSGKIASSQGSPGKGKRWVFPHDKQVDYWTGEE